MRPTREPREAAYSIRLSFVAESTKGPATLGVGKENIFKDATICIQLIRNNTLIFYTRDKNKYIR